MTILQTVSSVGGRGEGSHGTAGRLRECIKSPKSEAFLATPQEAAISNVERQTEPKLQSPSNELQFTSETEEVLYYQLL